jgi:hypothetical protein
MPDARNSKSMSSLSRALVAIVFVVSASFAGTAPVQAQGFAVAAQAGTAGVGGGVVLGLTSRLNVRAMYGFIPGDPPFTIDDIDFSLSLPSFLLTTVDLFPFGGFRLSGGGLLITNDDGGLDVVGTFDGRSVVLGATTFTGGPLDQMIGNFSLKRFQPYLGIGIGNPIGKRIGINFDAGVGFGSTPIVALTATGPLADLPGSTLDAELQQEVADIQADIPEFLKYYPVLSLSVSIGF